MKQNDFTTVINEFYPPKTEEQLKRWRENSQEILKVAHLMWLSGKLLSQTMKNTKYGQDIDPIDKSQILMDLGDLINNWERVTTNGDHLDLSLFAEPIHYVTGMAEESIELLIEVLEPIIYEKPYDIEKVIEESGDLFHYFTKFTEHFHLDHGVVRDMNYRKCSKRFKKGYSDAAAIAKADQKSSEDK